MRGYEPPAGCPMDILSDHPIGGWRGMRTPRYAGGMLLEIGIIVLSIVCFVTPGSLRSGMRKGVELVSFDDALGLVLTIAGLAYLVFAMLRPEKF